MPVARLLVVLVGVLILSRPGAKAHGAARFDDASGRPHQAQRQPRTTASRDPSRTEAIRLRCSSWHARRMQASVPLNRAAALITEIMSRRTVTALGITSGDPGGPAGFDTVPLPPPQARTALGSGEVAHFLVSLLRDRGAHTVDLLLMRESDRAHRGERACTIVLAPPGVAATVPNVDLVDPVADQKRRQAYRPQATCCPVNRLIDAPDANRWTSADPARSARLRSGQLQPVLADLISGKSTTDQALRDLRWLGLSDREASGTIRNLLLRGKTPEVIDPRPLGLPQRAAYLRRQEQSLTPAGLRALQRIDRALRERDARAVIELLPSVRHPHLEYFVPLHPDHAAEALFDLSAILTNLGCFRRCRHCFFAPDPRVRLIPFQRILGLLDAGEAPGRGTISRGALNLHEDSEPMDYYDPLYDADLGDLIAAILRRYPQQIIQFTTRMWFLGDAIGPRAASKIAALMAETADTAHPFVVSPFATTPIPPRKGQIRPRFSVDLYNTRGDLVRFMARLMENLDTFGPNPYVAGGFHLLWSTWDRDNKVQTQRVVDLVRSLLPQVPTWHVMGEVSKGGRARTLSSTQRNDVRAMHFGRHIHTDGAVYDRLPIDGAPARGTTATGEIVTQHRDVDTGIRLWTAAEILPAVVPTFVREKQGGFVLLQ